MHTPNQPGSLFETQNTVGQVFGESFNAGGNVVDIMSLILQETGTYDDMYHRDYVAQMSNDNLNGIVGDMLAFNHNRGSMQPQAAFSGSICNIASELIDLDPMRATNIIIPNGWGTKRFRFILQTRETNRRFPDKVFYTYVQGFTSMMDVSLQTRQLNPNTDFFVNSFVRIAEYTTMTPMGPTTGHRIVKQGQLVNGALISQSPGGHMAHFLRPADVLGGIQRQDSELFLDNSVTDHRSVAVMGSQTVGNNFLNNSPTSYLNRLLEPISNSLHSVGYGPATGKSIDNAVRQAAINEPMMVDSPILQALERRTGRPGASNFTLSELVAIDPTVGQRVQVNMVGASHQGGLTARGQSDDWRSAEPEALMAVKLLNSVPGLMWSHYIGSASLNITNQFGAGRVEIAMPHFSSITKFAPPETVQSFLTQIEQVLAKDISYNHQQMFSVMINASVLEDIQIQVSINGGGYRRYVAPTFGSGVLNPVYTTDAGVYKNLVDNMKYIHTGLETMISQDPLSGLHEGSMGV